VAPSSQNQLHTCRQPKRPTSHWSRYGSRIVVDFELFFDNDTLFDSRVKRGSRVTRSGPELRRRPSRGTNINPFTPREIQGWGRKGDTRVLNQDEAWVSTPQCIRDDSKPQKVLCCMCLLCTIYTYAVHAEAGFARE
jgi:hypothetical protein